MASPGGLLLLDGAQMDGPGGILWLDGARVDGPRIYEDLDNHNKTEWATARCSFPGDKTAAEELGWT